MKVAQEAENSRDFTPTIDGLTVGLSLAPPETVVCSWCLKKNAPLGWQWSCSASWAFRQAKKSGFSS